MSLGPSSGSLAGASMLTQQLCGAVLNEIYMSF